MCTPSSSCTTLDNREGADIVRKLYKFTYEQLEKNTGFFIGGGTFYFPTDYIIMWLLGHSEGKGCVGGGRGGGGVHAACM